jgi:hypothetical protein
MRKILVINNLSFHQASAIEKVEEPALNVRVFYRLFAKRDYASCFRGAWPIFGRQASF